MLFTALLSLVAGVLTVLAPCVLPFLPVIVGGSLGGGRRRPYLIAASLVVSLMAFTLLLKASTVLIAVDPRVWTILSGSIVVLLGISMLFPALWTRVAGVLKLGEGSHALLDKARSGRSGTLSAIATGAALGPVFSSCSPTYAWVIATVLPASQVAGLAYLTLYCIGMAGALLAIALVGRRLIDKLAWAADPRGWFQRTVAVLFIIVGLSIATGVDKAVQTWAAEWAPSVTKVEEDALRGRSADGTEQSRPAPELRGIQGWVNSDPTTLEQLKGKVVLIDFWTYSCINCMRTQPYLNAWYDAYHDQGFEIIGVHAPEFAFEKERANVERAVQQAGIRYPVALDNNFATWNAYDNHYWPAKYLIDREGNIRYMHFGEGQYATTEGKIRELLGASGPTTTAQPMGGAGLGQSAETYLGLGRARGFVGTPPLQSGSVDYTPADALASGQWTLGGRWKADGESITAESEGATLQFRFSGREMYLVMGGPPGSTVGVRVDGQVQHPGGDVTDGVVKVGDYRLYRLVSLPQTAPGTLVELTFSPGVKANAFTFGG